MMMYYLRPVRIRGIRQFINPNADQSGESVDMVAFWSSDTATTPRMPLITPSMRKLNPPNTHKT